MLMFDDRAEAGRRVAELDHLRGRDVVVLGLPRGGVAVAFEVAAALGAALEVIVVRKLGSRSSPSSAMGAIGEGGFRVVDPSVVERAHVTSDETGGGGGAASDGSWSRGSPGSGGGGRASTCTVASR